jgi:hypothetical protein
MLTGPSLNLYAGEQFVRPCIQIEWDVANLCAGW